MSLEKLHAASSEVPLTSDEVFGLLVDAGSVLNGDDRASDQALEIVIRLLDGLRSGAVPSGCLEAVQMLAEECGLFPYVNAASRSSIDQVVRAAHRVVLENEITLHAKQMEVLLSLLSGENVILSGPTSFGKSLILDAFVAKVHPKSVAAILPTLALIDETRRRISKNFPYFQIVTTVNEPFDHDKPVFFVLTQERFLQRKDIGRLELLFVDEFYKLDQGRDDSRYEILNLALYRAIPKARQIFMAGPHISTISLGRRWRGRFKFIATDYRTVAVNIIDRSAVVDRDKTFLLDLRSVGIANSLVFSASPPSAHRIADLILADGISYRSEASEKLAEWLAQNYHADWEVVKAAREGIGLHHGRIPRAIGQLFVKLFDAGILKVLICTSTLIEGVNTSASNVFIYDKKINKTDFDFFSFANIRGRVGRMMRHFVGNAYLYHLPPDLVDTDIDVPILSEDGPSSDYLLINVEDGDLDLDGLAAKQSVIDSSPLPLSVLRDHSHLGVALLNEINAKIIADLKKGADLIWSGYPNAYQRIATADVALFIVHRVPGQSPGLHTPKQVAWAWDELSKSKSLGEFIAWFSSKFFDCVNEGIEACFQFLQACEFAYPRALSVCESIVNVHVERSKSNYSLFTVELERWFRPGWMKTLDEMGVPVPLSERYAEDISDDASKAEALLRFASFSEGGRLIGVDATLYSYAFNSDDKLALDRPFKSN